MFGGDGCGLMGGALSERFDLSDAILGEDSGWDVGGWLQSGYTNKSDGVLNTRPDSWNVHQAWVYVEKIADGSEGLAFGGGSTRCMVSMEKTPRPTVTRIAIAGTSRIASITEPSTGPCHRRTEPSLMTSCR